jgi:bifunctional enzyme CysN/CysC
VTSSRDRLTVVIGGHVDHGKSTIIGRLLADSGAVPADKIDQVKNVCARTSKPFEYAFLLDALKDERAQGITIDAARVFFRTTTRDFIVIDAPGHVDLLKNMVTGAARADAALIVIDAREGVQENSRRHGYIAAMLGIRQVAVLVNKMDQVDCDPDRFARIEAEYRGFLRQVRLEPAAVIPVVGRDGDHLVHRSDRMEWYGGPTLVEVLNRFQAAAPDQRRPFRMPVQDVYKFTEHGDDRRIVAGTIESGEARVGDEIVFYPSGKRATIKSFEAFNQDGPVSAQAGQAVGFTLREQIFVARGELAARADEPRPRVTTRLRVSVFWLGRRPLAPGREYLLKIGTARSAVRVESIDRVIDASSLVAHEAATQVGRYEVAKCTLSCTRAVACDHADEVPGTGRFVIVDGDEICGGGTVREALPDRQDDSREQVLLREYKWEPSFIAPERRAARFAQHATLLIITGPKETDRKAVAKQLEAQLFDEGRAAYFLGMMNVLYGLDADLERSAETRREHVRRLAEIGNLMLDAGLILIVSAQELTKEELALIRTSVDPHRIATAWIGDREQTDLVVDILLSPFEGVDRNVEQIREWLTNQGALEPQSLVRPAVVWFTGLSGSGKTTVSARVAAELRDRGRQVEALDGDAVRDVFSTTGFTRPERDAHIRRAGYMASRLEQHGVFVLASFVSPYRESRDFVRGLCRNFVEVYVSTPLEECERRDSKGLYARARRGEIRQFTGIDDPYEAPASPDLVLDTSRLSVEEAGRRVLALLGARAGRA